MISVYCDINFSCNLEPQKINETVFLLPPVLRGKRQKSMQIFKQLARDILGEKKLKTNEEVLFFYFISF